MALQRPLKTGNVRTYVEEAALGFDVIDAPEIDADLDTIYTAFSALTPVPSPSASDVGKVLAVSAGLTVGWQAPPAPPVVPPALWADDTNYNMLFPIGGNRGIRLPAGGDGLIIAHSTYPTVDRRTGIDADDVTLQIHAGSSGIQFKTWDSTAILAQLSPAGRLTVGADPSVPLDVATKQYVDMHVGGGAPSGTVDMTTGAYLGSNQTSFPICSVVPLMVVGRAYRITAYIEINNYQAAVTAALSVWASGNTYLTFTIPAGTPPLRHARLDAFVQLTSPTAIRAEGTLLISTTGGFTSTPQMICAAATSSYTTPGELRLEGGYSAAHLNNYMQVQTVSVTVT